MKTKGLLPLLLLFFSLSSFAQIIDPILMKINGEGIKKSEFEYIYNKNNTAEAIDQKDLDEYLELFKNFKLKVFEARSQGLDTLLSFTKELQGYRRQLAQPYLEDKETEELFMQEAYDRMKENVLASHILIRFPQNYTVEDTLDAYNRIMVIRERVAPTSKKKKAEDFNTVAKEVSEDLSAEENGGRLGYVTAFRTVYPFENAAYNTPAGSVSMPVRSTFGYHLIKVEDRRSDPGERLAAHIMIMTPQGADEATMETAKLKIDSISDLIKNGMDFAEAAQQYSEDKGTAVNGGQLPWFGIGRMIKEFEDKAFALNKGEISEPFTTAFGYHIMKLIDTRPLASFDDKKNEIKSMIARSDRRNDMRATTAERLKKEFNYQLNSQNYNALIKQANAAQAVDSAFIADLKKQNAVLFTFDGATSYTQQQFADFLDKNKATPKLTPSDALADKFDQFVIESAFDYQDSSLEGRYPDFANLMKEYHDGILLFEVSNKEVWEKASKDTEGLKAFFEANKADYNWEKPKYKGFVISCADKKIEKEAQKLVKKTGADTLTKVLISKFNTSEGTGIKVEKVLVAEGENKAVDCFGFKTLDKKAFEAPEKFPYVFVTGKILKNPESYEDVRGLVTSDYQNHLEEEWLKYLRNKYTIEVDQNVLKTVQAKK